MKNLFVASTRHNEGKTLVGLGLAAGLAKRVKGFAFMKPLGRASVEFAGDRIDHDVALMKEACKIPAFVKDMGPVVFDGFPQAWTTAKGRDEAVDRIKSAYQRVSANKSLTLIEGSGNAAMGAAFGLSNAFLAKTLEAKVVLVATGGVGQPTDEIILNRSYFERTGVEIAGVIVNKAYPEELERIETWMRRVVEMMGVKLLGTIPYDHDLARGTLLNLFERLKGRVVNNEAGFNQPLGKVVVGAMSAARALEDLTGYVTLVAAPDREDLLVAALSAMFISGRKDFTLSSIVVAGKGALSETVTKMLKRTTIPVLHVDQDVYTVVSEVHAANFKILPTDQDRIARAIDVVQSRVDFDALLQALA